MHGGPSLVGNVAAAVVHVSDDALLCVLHAVCAVCAVLQAGRAAKLGPGFAVQMLQEADELGLQVTMGVVVGGGRGWWGFEVV